MDLISLVVWVVILGVIFYLLYWLVGQIPLPEPFGVVAKVLLGLAVVLVLLGVLTGTVPVTPFRLR